MNQVSSIAGGRRCRAVVLFLLVAGAARTVRADGLVGLDFADLMKIRVSSVERREKDIGNTPAAVTVLTQEDIRRSGANNIPDLLRSVPGLEVARATGNSWAISSRGGLDPLANRMLVLIDGRSVYTPLFAGVFWDVQDIPLETIDRIEIINGPGGSVWGANAVNGVINIIRKPAAASQGTTLSLEAGNEERFTGDIVTGGDLGPNVSATAYGRYREFDSLRKPGGGQAGDDGQQGGGGFRMDGKRRDADWTVSGDAYSGQFFENNTATTLSPPANIPVHAKTYVDGENVLGRWAQNLHGAGTVSVQGYVDRTRRDVPRRFGEIRDTADATAQHQISIARRHRFTWGAGFRTTMDRIDNTIAISFLPDRDHENIANFFAQDEIQMTRAWTVNLGAKWEYNTFTGWEIQPSARSAWEFLPNHVLWAAASRSVRTPTRIERDVRSESVFLSSPLVTGSILGSRDFDSERLTAYELGYRAAPTERLYWSVATFYNRYDNLRGAPIQPLTTETDPPPTHEVIDFKIANDMWGESYGGEIAPRFRVTDHWGVSASYSLLHQRYHAKNGFLETLVNNERADPMHQAALRSSWDIGRHVEADAGIRWVDRLLNTHVDDYTAVDARLAWQPVEALSLEAVGQNVLQPYHREFSPGNEVERAWYGRASWHFR